MRTSDTWRCIHCDRNFEVPREKRGVRIVHPVLPHRVRWSDHIDDSSDEPVGFGQHDLFNFTQSRELYIHDPEPLLIGEAVQVTIGERVDGRWIDPIRRRLMPCLEFDLRECLLRKVRPGPARLALGGLAFSGQILQSYWHESGSGRLLVMLSDDQPYKFEICARVEEIVAGRIARPVGE